ncbi:hypothetical protein FB451DRAFT_1414539 [Mycena latifolia]|nr:hypothetical protein FB451DRAFT_1414539 [Mycena latifolia]
MSLGIWEGALLLISVRLKVRPFLHSLPSLRPLLAVLIRASDPLNTPRTSPRPSSFWRRYRSSASLKPTKASAGVSRLRTSDAIRTPCAPIPPWASRVAVSAPRPLTARALASALRQRPRGCLLIQAKEANRRRNANGRIRGAPLLPPTPAIGCPRRPRGRCPALRHAGGAERTRRTAQEKECTRERKEEAHTSQRWGLRRFQMAECSRRGCARPRRPHPAAVRAGLDSPSPRHRARRAYDKEPHGALPVPETRKDASAYWRLRLSKDPPPEISKDPVKARRGGVGRPFSVTARLLMGAIAIVQLEDAEDLISMNEKRRIIK